MPRRSTPPLIVISDLAGKAGGSLRPSTSAGSRRQPLEAACRGRGPDRSAAYAPRRRRSLSERRAGRGWSPQTLPPSTETRSGSGLAQRTLARSFSQSIFSEPFAGVATIAGPSSSAMKSHRVVDLPGRPQGSRRSGRRPRRHWHRRCGRKRRRAGTESRVQPGCRTPPSFRRDSPRRSSSFARVTSWSAR